MSTFEPRYKDLVSLLKDATAKFDTRPLFGTKKDGQWGWMSYGEFGRLVDQVWGDICDGDEKRSMLLQTCERLGIAVSQAIAVGDGANDLPMMGAAGLSVAYHAKPRVREQSMVSIEHGGLDRLLTVFGNPAD